MPSALDIENAVTALHAGAIIAYPTEAVWGLGCDPFNEDSVQQLLALKQRDVAKGLILVAANLAQLAPYIQTLSLAQQQLINSTDTPTTWLVPFIASKVPRWISGDHALLAVRVSQHPIVQQLCLAADIPLISTSANPAGLAAATSATQVQAYFPQLPYCEGSLGAAKHASTIKNLLTGAVIR